MALSSDNSNNNPAWQKPPVGDDSTVNPQIANDKSIVSPEVESIETPKETEFSLDLNLEDSPAPKEQTEQKQEDNLVTKTTENVEPTNNETTKEDSFSLDLSDTPMDKKKDEEKENNNELKSEPKTASEPKIEANPEIEIKHNTKTEADAELEVKVEEKVEEKTEQTSPNKEENIPVEKTKIQADTNETESKESVVTDNKSKSFDLDLWNNSKELVETDTETTLTWPDTNTPTPKEGLSLDLPNDWSKKKDEDWLKKEDEKLDTTTKDEKTVVDSVATVVDSVAKKTAATPVETEPSAGTFSLDDLTLNTAEVPVVPEPSPSPTPTATPAEVTNTATQIPIQPDVDGNQLDLTSISMDKIKKSEAATTTAPWQLSLDNLWSTAATVETPTAAPQTPIQPPTNMVNTVAPKIATTPAPVASSYIAPHVNKTRKVASVIILVLLMLWGGIFVLKTMYPVEFTKFKDKITGNGIEQEVQPDNNSELIFQPTTDKKATWDDIIAETTTPQINPAQPKTQIETTGETAPIAGVWTSAVNTWPIDTFEDFDPFEEITNMIEEDSVSPYQDKIDELRYYAEQGEDYMLLAEKTRDAGIKKLANVLITKAPEHIETLEAGDVDEETMATIDKHLNLFKSYLDRLDGMVVWTPPSN